MLSLSMITRAASLSSSVAERDYERMQRRSSASLTALGLLNRRRADVVREWERDEVDPGRVVPPALVRRLRLQS
jgi:hypothetical protein